MSTASFVHLHVHSHHSLNGGLASVDALMRRAAELEMPALALTDHASLAGLVEVFEAGRRCGVKPIVGCDLPMRPTHGPRVRSESTDPELPTGQGRGQDPMAEITLFAMTDGGLRNLIALHNLAWSRAVGSTPPHATLEDLSGRAQGLVALLGGERSELGRLLACGEVDSVDEHLAAFVKILGRRNIRFEIIGRVGDGTAQLGRRVLEITNPPPASRP